MRECGQVAVEIPVPVDRTQLGKATTPTEHTDQLERVERDREAVITLADVPRAPTRGDAHRGQAVRGQVAREERRHGGRTGDDARGIASAPATERVADVVLVRDHVVHELPTAGTHVGEGDFDTRARALPLIEELGE